MNKTEEYIRRTHILLLEDAELPGIPGLIAKDTIKLIEAAYEDGRVSVRHEEFIAKLHQGIRR